MRALKWLCLFGGSNIGLLLLARLAAEVRGAGPYAFMLMPIANIGLVVAIRLKQRPPQRSVLKVVATDLLLLVALDLLLFVVLLMNLEFPRIPG